MTNNDSLVIVPVYSGKNKIFQGYCVYDNGKQVKKNGKPVVLKLQQDQKYYTSDENENVGPKKNAPDGIYELGDYDAGLGISGYKVKFGTRVWNITTGTYEHHSQPSLIFSAKEDDNVFKGYTIHQYNEDSKKMETRGFVSLENVTYRRQKNGAYACYYNETYLDGVEVAHYMETISREEYNQRMASTQNTKNNTLEQFSHANITNDENLNHTPIRQTHSR